MTVKGKKHLSVPLPSPFLFQFLPCISVLHLLPSPFHLSFCLPFAFTLCLSCLPSTFHICPSPFQRPKHFQGLFSKGCSSGRWSFQKPFQRFSQRLLKVSSITTFQRIFSRIFSKAVLQSLQKAFQIQKTFPKPVQSLFQSSKAFPMAYPKPLEKAVPKFRSFSQKLC